MLSVCAGRRRNGGASGEKCCRYMQDGGEVVAKTSKSAVVIWRLVMMYVQRLANIREVLTTKECVISRELSICKLNSFVE